MAPSRPARRVLVIDDDSVIIELLRVNFEMEGYQVDSAPDGIVGLEKAAADAPDVIILDVMMPRIDGLEVARRLRAEDATARIPIVFLSAKAQYGDVMAGEALAEAYVTKPFDPLDLLEQVDSLVRAPRL